jgi:hypothetical protein
LYIKIKEKRFTILMMMKAMKILLLKPLKIQLFGTVLMMKMKIWRLLPLDGSNWSILQSIAVIENHNWKKENKS